MDPRDGIVVWTELDDHCDNLAVVRRMIVSLHSDTQRYDCDGDT